MKATYQKIIFLLTAFLLLFSLSFAQEDFTGKIVKITKQDGSYIIGELIQDDGRELLIINADLGKIYIPKHEVKQIAPVTKSDNRNGRYVGDDRFATRYSITTNGLPIKKGEHYAMLNIFGPEVHFAVADNLSVGFLTTWVASPIVGSLKLSLNPNPDSKINMSVGVLAGGLPFFGRGYGALGYGALTIGDRKSNFTVSAGYAGVTDGQGSGGTAPLMSIAGLVKTNENFSIVLDSFIYLGNIGENNGGVWALILPGVRYNRNNQFAIQVGIGSLVTSTADVPPIPFPQGNLFFSLN
ncbi:MAG: hypothetical protein MRZ79_02345 [Bacteroidia bacterium]|nr:hypothetical protein [Bacteroidia bacterium]